MEQENMNDKILNKKPLDSIANIKSTNKKIVQDYRQLVQNEINKLILICEHIQVIANKCDDQKAEAEDKLRYMKKQQSTHSVRYEKIVQRTNYHELVDNIEQNVTKLNENYIQICRERVQQAQNINIRLLSSLNIKSKNDAVHRIFKWILVVIYKQPISRYFWENFKEQVFENDEGVDFIQRLGKTNPLKTNYQEKKMTEDLLFQFEEILESATIKKAKLEFQRIYRIIIAIKKGYEIGVQAYQLDKKLGYLNQQETAQRQRERQMQKIKQAYSQRATLIEDYLKAICQSKSKILKKKGSYQERINIGKHILKQLNLIFDDLEVAKKIQPKKLEVQGALGDKTVCKMF